MKNTFNSIIYYLILDHVYVMTIEF